MIPSDYGPGGGSAGEDEAGGNSRGEVPAELVCVGVIVKIRGVRGEMEVEPLGGTLADLSGDPRLFLEGKEGDGPRTYFADGVRRLGTRIGLKLKGIDTPEGARAHIGDSVFIDSRLLPALPEGYYYHYQIVGLEVVDVDGQILGELVDVFETGGNDVYVVRGEEQEILLPAIDQVILEVDLEAGRMKVRVPPGLIE